MGKPKPLVPRESLGDGGVTRIAYFDQNGRKIGEARMMGQTIGDIHVSPRKRRKGYGTAILRDLIDRGGRNAFGGSDEGRAILLKAGFVETGGRLEYPA